MNSRSMLRAQRGLTLVEIMVAVLITGIMILGVGTLLSSSSRARQVQTAVSSLNETGRFAVDTLARDLRMAGYRQTDWALGSIPNPITGVDGPGEAGGDSITVQYEAARDCNYAPTQAGLATNVYAINGDALECNGQPIVAGIEQMQVYFGEDIDNDGVANRLLAPGTAGLDMSRVVTVQIHLLAHTNAANVASVNAVQGYYFDNVIQPPINDGQIRREYSLTIALRNPM